MSKIKVVEEYILIARRVPPGDKWRLVANEPDGPIHNTLTDALEAYMTKTGFRGDYKFCLLYTSPSPRDRQKSRMPSSA